MKPNNIAFDSKSVRTFDADGRMHVERTNISKANVCPYMGREIPNWQTLGLDPNKIYRLYRDPEELAKGASTFNNLPLLKRHIQVSADDPKKDDVVGSIGSDVEFIAPYLTSSICVWDSEAIAGIETEAIEELSSAYRYDADMTSGTTPEGDDYDGVMRNIRANHLALVESGRAGSDVVVADSNPFIHKESTVMKKTKLGMALLAALSAVSPKLAQDSALSSLFGGAVKGKFNAKEASGKLIALDSDLDGDKVEEVVEAILGVEETPVATDPLVKDEDDNGAPSKHAEIIDYLRGKGLDPADLEAVGNMLSSLSAAPAADEEVEGVVKAEDVDKQITAAMDGLSKKLHAEFKALEAAKIAVRKVVGDVIGMDSAEGVYRFALDHLGVDHKETEASGLANLFAVANRGDVKPAHIAQDSSLKVQFPGLDRFKQA